MCLVGAFVASWSLTKELTGSSPFNDKYLLNSVKTFRKNSIKLLERFISEHILL